MATDIPRWANTELSEDLPSICEAGESTSVEFKEMFPEQLHKVAQELAALATSGGGILFVGINDNCEIVGVDVPDGDARDKLALRAQGIAESVCPDLKSDVLFAVHGEDTVLAIKIPKQVEPVFYYDYRPYIRDDRLSRRATPNEVKERVWSHPSAEHQRDLERIELQNVQLLHDSNRSFVEASQKQRERNAETHERIRRGEMP